MMLRLLVGLSVSVVVFAQGTTRMTQIVEAQTDDDKFMGAVLVARDGDVLFEKSHGFSNVEWQVPNTPATKFRIGSVTKQFTAASRLRSELFRKQARVT